MKKRLLLLLSLLGAVLAGYGSGKRKSQSKELITEKVDQTITIYLVRHGQTWFNTMNQVQGVCDSPLTASGENQAKLVGEGLADVSFVAAYSSDLGRQRSTAQIILAQNNNAIPSVTEHKGFREKNFGSFEGRSNDTLTLAVAKTLGKKHPTDSDALWDFLNAELNEEELASKVNEVDFTNTAETYDQMKQRVEKVMSDMIAAVNKMGGGNVLVVSSGGIIPILLESIAPGEYSGEKIGNCSVTTLAYKDGAYTIKGIGDTRLIADEIISNPSQFESQIR